MYTINIVRIDAYLHDRAGIAPAKYLNTIMLHYTRVISFFTYLLRSHVALASVRNNNSNNNENNNSRSRRKTSGH